MKKTIFTLVLIATFATKSFAHCPIPQWCPDAPLHQTLCPGEQIDPIEFPSVIGRTLIITWWTNETRIHSFENPPEGIIVSGDASTPLGEREYAWPVSIKGTPTAIGTHHYTVSNTCGVELLHGSITLGAPPTIGMVTPTIDQTTWQNIPFDSTLTLTDEPTGMPPITIQWYSNTTASTTGGTSMGTANGAQTNTFTPPYETINTDGVFYYAVATDRCGRTATTPNTSGKHIVSACNGDLTTAVFLAAGAPSFRTGTTWTVGSGANERTWSDVVIAPYCKASAAAYTAGVTTNNPTDIDKWGNSDCVKNGSYGDLFSWCMVLRFQDLLCPPGDNWRVPTLADFQALQASGATANPAGATWLQNSWGGAFTGYLWGTTLYIQGFNGYYWSLTEGPGSPPEYAENLYFLVSYVTTGLNNKGLGFALRCVKDN
ncbi:MAG: fibrobacter succinogenes major paralogous domain-containing protein [Bacteroidales bacterium]|nr:fibrobacter succinogenes major paralogous domain-containing protein [Bacteroidales bacterium]